MHPLAEALWAAMLMALIVGFVLWWFFPRSSGRPPRYAVFMHWLNEHWPRRLAAHTNDADEDEVGIDVSLTTLHAPEQPGQATARNDEREPTRES